MARAFIVALTVVVASNAFAAPPSRSVISLNGSWQVAEGGMDKMPVAFDHTVPVPGLVDMAQPPFIEVGTPKSNDHRRAFWYRRTFHLDGPATAVAVLKIHKACYGTAVYLNGRFVGEHLPCFTPLMLDVRKHLRNDGGANELVIRVGAYRDALPRSIPDGWDMEKLRYIPGIYDSVELILSGTPRIVNVQTVPDLEHKAVRVVATLQADKPISTLVRCRVCEAASGKEVGGAEIDSMAVPAGQEKRVELRIPIENCRTWSPEDPFLYRLEVTTAGDVFSTRFGMRTFSFDPQTKRPMLNGRPYYLRGTNVCIFRFFEDAARGDRPWRAEWVRRLHQTFRGMNWNSARYCIGFPPEQWYDIADELGVLIQDEFPIWYAGENGWPREIKSDELAREYAEWMRERWNHPCVVLWDAQNETITEETGKAIRAVRGLDLSHRPWDNGWSPAQAPGDTHEAHAYLFMQPGFQRPSDMAHISGVPKGSMTPNVGHNPIILNEYGLLGLNRDGSCTTTSKEVYERLLGKNSMTRERRHLCARLLAAETEFWRAHRACAGVMHFCGLGYSRPDGQTSDHFRDVEKLTLDPEFDACLRDAFAPVGLMLDFWDEQLPGGRNREVPVVVVNDLGHEWAGQVRLRLRRDGRLLAEQTRPCRVEVFGTGRQAFTLGIPDQPGHYELEAALLQPTASPVRSLREFDIRP